MDEMVKIFDNDNEANAILLMSWFKYAGYPERKSLLGQLKWYSVWCKEPLHERMIMNMCAGYDPDAQTYFEEFLRVNLESPEALLSKCGNS